MKRTDRIITKTTEISNKLREFIANAKVFEAKEIRELILKKCEVSRVAYSYWLKGKRVPNMRNKTMINSIIKSYGYPTIY